MDLKNPFPNNEGSVHLWQGDDDRLVPVTLQRYIVSKLPWIRYHELPGAGHLFPRADGMGEAIMKELLTGEKQPTSAAKCPLFFSQPLSLSFGYFWEFEFLMEKQTEGIIIIGVLVCGGIPS